MNLEELRKEENIEFSRIWAMSNKNTFSILPIKAMLSEEVGEGLWIDPFANTSKIASVTNDMNPEMPTDYHLDAVDFLKMFKAESVDGVLYDPPYCYDGETEILTKNGFKNITKISKEDLLATLNTASNCLEYQHPTEIIKQGYKGNMVSIESQSISLLVTPNHRCYVKNSFYGSYKWIYAKDLFATSKAVWFKKACEWNAKEEEFFALPEITLEKPNRYGEKVKLEKKIPMNLWLKFLGLYLSEGSWKKNFRKISKSGRIKYYYTIAISQVKPEIREKIIQVLNELGYKYTVSKNDFRIEDKQLWNYVKQFGDSSTVFIPEDIKKLPKQQLQVLIDYLMLGDGCHITYPKENKIAKKTYSYTTNTYYTKSLRLRDDFAEIAIKCGYGVTVNRKRSGVYSVHMLKAKDFRVYEAACNKSVFYDDAVYCVSVPNTTLLIKRNNKVFWCGNSLRQVSECYKGFGKEVTMETTQSSFMSKQKKEIGRIVKLGGKAICFGWNSAGIGKKYGFSIKRILIVPHGGMKNDTICTVCVKTHEPEPEKERKVPNEQGTEG